MRIIGGRLGGRILPFPKHFSSRATTDVAKEALFNILDNVWDYRGLYVLDLFAGTGNISYEFTSRGCERVVAVEHIGKNAAFIRDTARDFEMQELQVLKTDALKYITNAPESYDLVFADPPYDAEFVATLPNRILESHLMAPNAWFVLEHSKFHAFGDHPWLFDQRKYGHVFFSFFRKNTD